MFRSEEGIRYLGPGREERLDLYRPDDGGSGVLRPALVVIHGGGWRIGARNDAREKNICEILSAAGYVCASIDYLLFREDVGAPTWPRCLLDCKAAVQWLRVNAERLGIRKTRIGAIGSSAGGHLSAMLATTAHIAELNPDEPFGAIDTSIQACASLYGVMNPMRAFANDRWTRSFSRMMGTGGEAPCEAWLAASPVHGVSSGTCPMLLAHGDADPLVDYRQMDEMKASLDAVGVECRRIVVPGAVHTFDLERQFDGRPLSVNLAKSVVDFLDTHLKGGKP